MSNREAVIMARSSVPEGEVPVMDRMRKVALWVIAAAIAVGVLYVAYPQLFQNFDHTFNTPKGDYVVRLDKDGNPTAFIPDSDAERNGVRLVVTFKNGVKKTCNGQCPIDGDIDKIEAKVGNEIIATWP